jgi:hypothetical protein
LEEKKQSFQVGLDNFPELKNADPNNIKVINREICIVLNEKYIGIFPIFPQDARISRGTKKVWFFSDLGSLGPSEHILSTSQVDASFRMLVLTFFTSNSQAYCLLITNNRDITSESIGEVSLTLFPLIKNDTGLFSRLLRSISLSNSEMPSQKNEENSSNIFLFNLTSTEELQTHFESFHYWKGNLSKVKITLEPFPGKKPTLKTLSVYFHISFRFW